MTVDEILALIRVQLDLEAETEHELLEELRFHLEEAIEDARARGLDERAAVQEAAAHFGIESVGQQLQDTHAGWGTLEGVAAAALPVILTLLLRWLIFDPDGTAVGWQQMLNRPALWSLALIALLVPLLRFPRRRHALVAWAVFWALSVIISFGSTIRW
jgi:hypothetical protein